MKTGLMNALLTDIDWAGPLGAFVLAWVLVPYLPPLLILVIGWGAVLQWQRWRRKQRQAPLTWSSGSPPASNRLP